MSEYRTRSVPQSSISTAAKTAKAKRQAVLQRVRAQRAVAHKRTVAEWIQVGMIIRGNTLKERYQRGK